MMLSNLSLTLYLFKDTLYILAIYVLYIFLILTIENFYYFLQRINFLDQNLLRFFMLNLINKLDL